MAVFEYQDKQYEFVMKLGAGAFGDTYQYKSGDKLFTIKISTVYNSFTREVTALKALSSVCMSISIPCLRDTFTIRPNTDIYTKFDDLITVISPKFHKSNDSDSNGMYQYKVVIYDFINGVPFSKIVSGRGYNGTNTPSKNVVVSPLDVHLLISLGNQLLYTLSYMHEKGIAHRDIKPANIIWNPDSNKFTLIDFGAACTLNKCIGGMAGSPNYILPESLTNKKFESFEQSTISDIYALGTCMYCYITGTPPYEINVTRQPGSQVPNYQVMTDVDPFMTNTSSLSLIPEKYYLLLRDMILQPNIYSNNTQVLYQLWTS